MTTALRLSEQELAFFRLTFDLFPTPESPLRYLQEQEEEPDDPETIFSQLEERDLLDAKGAGASQSVRERLQPVSECSARVVVRLGSSGEDGTRSFYLADEVGVEYEHREDEHFFGEPLTEGELARVLAGDLNTTEQIRARPLSMTASDYLVFAVFARDLRATSEAEPEDAPMSVDEVLAFFDEPETTSLHSPSEDCWQRSVEILCHDGALVKTGDGYALHPSLHAVAREIVADHQHTIMRFDFLDEHWLVREVSLYPTAGTVYRLGTKPEGSVVIEELSTTTVVRVVSEVVTTLPNILNPELQPMLRSAAIQAQGGI